MDKTQSSDKNTWLGTAGICKCCHKIFDPTECPFWVDDLVDDFRYSIQTIGNGPRFHDLMFVGCEWNETSYGRRINFKRDDGYGITISECLIESITRSSKEYRPGELFDL